MDACEYARRCMCAGRFVIVQLRFRRTLCSPHTAILGKEFQYTQNLIANLIEIADYPAIAKHAVWQAKRFLLSSIPLLFLSSASLLCANRAKSKLPRHPWLRKARLPSTIKRSTPSNDWFSSQIQFSDRISRFKLLSNFLFAPFYCSLSNTCVTTCQKVSHQMTHLPNDGILWLCA